MGGLSAKTRAGAALVCAALLLSATATAAAAARLPGERCEYVEAGPPGPRGNRLVFHGYADPVLVRHGEEIELRQRAGLGCTGPRPTVRNLDRIVIDTEGGSLTLDERGGRLSPGATGERRGSEIEIFVRETSELRVYGGPRRNAISLRTRPDGDYGINLDLGADRRRPDDEVRIAGDGFKTIGVHGEQGDDLIDARRLTGIGDNEYLTSRVRLLGGAGDDTVLGGPGQEELKDGPGDDLIRAGPGNDAVELGRGSDVAYGGAGDDALSYEFLGRGPRRHADAADRLYGGPGDDVLSDKNRAADLLDCGPGRDRVEGERLDPLGPGCESYLGR